jgi:hypothetical protein
VLKILGEFLKVIGFLNDYGVWKKKDHLMMKVVCWGLKSGNKRFWGYVNEVL